MLINNDLLSAIDAKIDNLASEYNQVQGLILTEDDLKCNLYCKLIQIPYLAEPDITADSWIKASKVHAELTWFNSVGELRIKPDITILDPRNLSIVRAVQSGFDLPSKGCHFVGDAIIFELKFIRGHGGIAEATLQSVKDDVAKIKRLYEKIEGDGNKFSLVCYIVFFAKVSVEGSDMISNFQAEMAGDSRFRVFYRSGGVSFTNPYSA